MPNPLVIIHGWSDNSASFKQLAIALQTRLKRAARLINLADYVSMDDEVTYDDLVTALSFAWQVNKLPNTPSSVDVIVHSTGGLIIRDWISRNFTPQTVPIKHLVMLAPANFGSALAHKGNAFYGRIIKGFNSQKLLQVGAKLLKGLELASPYSWQLAQRDRFGTKNFYGPDNILCTVLIGNTGYKGISAAANEDGSDGTVRIACANLNCAYIKADFSQDPLNPTYTLARSKGTTAFAVLDKENHSTITNKDNSAQNPDTLNYIYQALTVTDKDFPAWCKTLTDKTSQLMQQGTTKSATHGFQNTVSFVHDQFDQHIQDYFLEFYGDEENLHWLAQLFHGGIITTTHAYIGDTSFRSLYMDCTLLQQELTKDWQTLNISLTALPEFKRNGNVGYRTFTDKDIGAIAIAKTKINEIFTANRTLLLEILLRREQAETLLTIQPLSEKT